MCHVSAVSRGRSPGDCFSQLGQQLFVITGEAATSHSRSSPILMGWWSAQRNDYRSPLVELAKTTNSVKGITKRGIIVQARTASQIIWGDFCRQVRQSALYKQVVKAKPSPASTAACPAAPCLPPLHAGRQSGATPLPKKQRRKRKNERRRKHTHTLH